MKKRFAAGVLGGLLALTVTAGSVWAETYAFDFSDEETGQESTIYFTEEDDSVNPQVFAVGTITEYGNPDEIGLSEEEKKKLRDWYKEEMRERIAYLESYGVTYDGEEDEILYQGKTVRWLIDRQIDDTCMAIQMPEGEIDLYTVRAEDFKLTGVRIASQEEYDERTESGTDSGESSAAGGGGTQNSDCYESAEMDVTVEEDAEVAYSVSASEASEEQEQEQKQKIEEYEQAGIGYDSREGEWLWQEKPIYLLADENGSLYQNGSEAAVKNKIYVIVKRNDDGTIKEAKQVTMEEVVKEKIVMDE